MQQFLTNTLTSILSTVKDILTFLSDLLSKENGIRSLYIVILTIPGVCLLFLYYKELKASEELQTRVRLLEIESNMNYRLYITAKDSVRATVFKEYIELSKAMNELQESLNQNNDEKTKKILKYTNKVNEEINRIE